MKRFVAALLVLVMILSFATVVPAEEADPIKIKVLILPKFEIGAMSGDAAGEAQLYYEAYCMGGEEYEILGGFADHKLYVKDGVALYVTGEGKVASAISLAAILNDRRFDFSDCYIISTGCAGSSYGYSVVGDVYVITACVDFDLGHHADARELSDPDALTWFMDTEFPACVVLNTELMDKVYALVKDVNIVTTPTMRNWMLTAFDGADWAGRDAKILRGTTVSGDNYWKGMWDHKNAVAMVEAYKCPDPYAVTEMEDVALGFVLQRYGMLDRYIVIRDAVNMDVFMYGDTPETLWGKSLGAATDLDSGAIFQTARENNFMVGKVIIDAILDGSL